MWRALLFLLLLAVAAYGAVWLANHPETVSLTWQGREYTVSLATGIVGLLVAGLVIAAILGFIRLILSVPGAVGRGARERRQQRGRAAVTRGIVAVGAGDLAAARRHAAEAERLLGHEPLALLLKAQAAQASGDREAAEGAFRAMLAKPETRVLGLRGLYLEARLRDDDVEARAHAEEASRLAPAIGWAHDAVIEGHSSDGDWRSAVALVERRTSLGLVDRPTSKRQRAVLLTADAAEREQSDPEGALATAQDAVKLAPDLVPAAALAGRLLSRRGDLKRAAKVLEGAWRAGPHPEIAGAYLNLRPGDSATDRMRRAETLARLSSWSDESRLAIARAAIEARDLDRARDVLRPLMDEGRPTVRACTTMAEIEGKGGNPGGAREWLARATRAPRDKAWIADGYVSDQWAPVSPITGRLDAFRWETPPELLAGSDGAARLDHASDVARFEPVHEPEPLPLPGLAPLPGFAPLPDQARQAAVDVPAVETPALVDAVIPPDGPALEPHGVPLPQPAFPDAAEGAPSEPGPDGDRRQRVRIQA